MRIDERLAPWVLAACFLVWTLVPAGPWFDGTAEFLDYITAFGALIGGITAPFAIYFAVRIHRESTHEPRNAAVKKATDQLHSVVKMLPFSLAMRLFFIYVQFGPKMKEVKGTSNAENLAEAVRWGDEGLELARDAFFQMERIERWIADLPDDTRRAAFSLMVTLRAVDQQDDGPADWTKLLRRVRIMENCAIDAATCRKTLDFEDDPERIEVMETPMEAYLPVARSFFHELEEVKTVRLWRPRWGHPFGPDPDDQDDAPS